MGDAEVLVQSRVPDGDAGLRDERREQLLILLVEPQGFARLVKDIRAVERALGDGVKQVYASELPVMRKLRRVGLKP